MKKVTLVLLTMMLAACNSGSSNETNAKEPNEEDQVVCYIDGSKDTCDKTTDVVDGESKFGEGTW